MTIKQKNFKLAQTQSLKWMFKNWQPCIRRWTFKSFYQCSSKRTSSFLVLQKVWKIEEKLQKLQKKMQTLY